MAVEESQDGGTLLAESPATEVTPWHSPEYSEVVAQRGWKDANGPLKGYTELEKLMGNSVRIPTAESPDEEVRSYYMKIGRPENPDGYEIKDVPDNIIRDEEAENHIKSIAHEIGCPKTAFEAIVKAFYTNQSERLIASKIQGETILKQEWQTKYPENIEISQRACREFGGDDLVEYLIQTGLGNNPLLVKAFCKVGQAMMEDKIVTGEGVEKTEDGKDDYQPEYPMSPEQYRTGDDEESKKARAWFTKVKGFQY